MESILAGCGGGNSLLLLGVVVLALGTILGCMIFSWKMVSKLSD